MADDTFGRYIEQGDVEGLRRALEADRTLANRTIRWHLNQDNESAPLHYVCDCVGHGWLTNGTEGEIAELLLAFAAEVNGAAGRASPLIASACWDYLASRSCSLRRVPMWRRPRSTHRARCTGQRGWAHPQPSGY